MTLERNAQPGLAVLLAAAWMAASAPEARSHATGPPPAHTGDFGQQSCAASSCHVGNAVNASGGSLAITGLPAQYEPGRTYTLTITINRSGQSRWGFECSVRQVAGGLQAGSLVPTDTLRTEVETAAGIQYIRHNFLGAQTGAGPKSWTFNWTAPASAVGAVRCSCAGNAANGNGTNTGDFIYTTTATTNPAASLEFLTTLYYPRLVTTDNDFTGIAVANLDSGGATLRFTSYDRSGDPLASSPGVSLTNPKELALAAGAQLPVVDTEVFGQGLTTRKPTGWFKIESTVRRVVGFFLMFDAGLSMMDGADVGTRALTSFLLPEVEDLGFTQIHIANPNASAATLSLDLVRADGSTRASAARTVNPSGAVAEILTDLFPGVSPSGSDYVRVIASQAVVPFEYLGRTGQYGEGVNGQDLAAAATTLYSPQYVVGGGIFRTALSIVNADGASGTVELRLIGDEGSQIGGTRTQQIPANGKLWITDQDFFVAAGGTLTQGYVEIKSSGPRLTGSVVFGDPGRSTFSASLPLVTSLQSRVVFGQLASNSTFFTGLAILNPSGATVSAAIDVYDASGNLVVNTVQAIGPGRRVSRLMTQYFPGLVGQSYSSGYFRVTADQPVASFALFGATDSLGNISVLSAVPPQEVVP